MRRAIILGAAFLLTAALDAVSIWTAVQTSRLSLPISPFAIFLAIFIPLLNLIFLYLSFQKSTSITFNPFSLSLLAILDTILLTFSASDLRPVVQTCFLDTKWRAMYHLKDAAGIRGIQDALECCGFRGVRDKAWPFQGNGHGVEECVKAYGRSQSCEGMWGRERRVVLGLMVAIAAGGLVCKVVVVLVVRYGPEWASGQMGTRGHGRGRGRGRIAGRERIEEEEEGEIGGGGRYLDNVVDEQGEGEGEGGERAVRDAVTSG